VRRAARPRMHRCTVRGRESGGPMMQTGMTSRLVALSASMLTIRSGWRASGPKRCAGRSTTRPMMRLLAEFEIIVEHLEGTAGDAQRPKLRAIEIAATAPQAGQSSGRTRRIRASSLRCRGDDHRHQCARYCRVADQSADRTRLEPDATGLSARHRRATSAALRSERVRVGEPHPSRRCRQSARHRRQ
jgi:hypothetical protein